MQYKIIDTQGTGHIANEIFNTKQAVIDRLASFHSADFDSANYEDIYEFIDSLHESEQLNELLEYGQWSLDEGHFCKEHNQWYSDSEGEIDPCEPPF